MLCALSFCDFLVSWFALTPYYSLTCLINWPDLSLFCLVLGYLLFNLTFVFPSVQYFRPASLDPNVFPIFLMISDTYYFLTGSWFLLPSLKTSEFRILPSLAFATWLCVYIFFQLPVIWASLSRFDYWHFYIQLLWSIHILSDYLFHFYLDPVLEPLTCLVKSWLFSFLPLPRTENDMAVHSYFQMIINFILSKVYHLVNYWSMDLK